MFMTTRVESTVCYANYSGENIVQLVERGAPDLGVQLALFSDFFLFVLLFLPLTALL